jgi:PA domain
MMRGTCSFKIKAINAQNASAAGVVMFNNTDGPLNGSPDHSGHRHA